MLRVLCQLQELCSDLPRLLMLGARLVHYKRARERPPETNGVCDVLTQLAGPPEGLFHLSICKPPGNQEHIAEGEL